MRKSLLIIMIQCCCGLILAQNKINTLNAEEYLQMVRQFHPVVKLARIDIEKSNAEIMKARGAFNPIISNYLANKTIGNLNYYNYIHPSITVPTWFGVDISVGIENLSGNRFDPSETIGKTSYVGVSIPLLKNLAIDKRRAYLKQAKLYNEMAFIEQQIAINDILKEAISTYWEWVNAYQGYEIVAKNYTISQQRFEFVKKTVLNGERPAIDTVEAMTQFQNLEFQKNERWLSFQNKGIEISAFLWNENNTPYQLPDTVVPQNGWENEVNIKKNNLQLTDLQQNAKQFHPELRRYDQKTKVLEIDKKLKFQELLPKLNFNYNHFSKGYNIFQSEGFLFQNNFQYGLKFEMPLFLSQGRGEYKQAKLKIQENEVFQSQKMQSIEIKVKIYFNEYLNLKTQIALQSSMLDNFRKLLKAETTLFQNGESSLFLINSRENKVLESENKLVELKTKYFKSIYTLQWAAGILQ
jgi:outer membrane protein TolC